jgi:hypothetical protein
MSENDCCRLAMNPGAARLPPVFGVKLAAKLTDDFGKYLEAIVGGTGSGRRNQSGRGTTSDCWSLDVRRFQREGLLTPGQVFGWNWTRDGETLASIFVRAGSDTLTLNYRQRLGNEVWQPMEYTVPLDWTACTYGGRSGGNYCFSS